VKVQKNIFHTKFCLTNPLHASAKAAFNSCGCLVEAGLAGQVGVKSGCVRWRGGVSCRTSPLSVRFVVRRVNGQRYMATRSI
jgi:hypothetical protein